MSTWLNPIPLNFPRGLCMTHSVHGHGREGQSENERFDHTLFVNAPLLENGKVKTMLL